MTNTFKIDHKNNQGVIEIVLTGQLTINTIDKIMAKMKEIIVKPSEVSIQVEDVENMDLTFIQLIFAIKNSGKKEKYKVEVSFDLSEELTSLITNAGFQKILN